MRIDANPFTFECLLEHSALVIIDMQRNSTNVPLESLASQGSSGTR
ncbi:MAG: hypothetical protein KKE41_20245 [Gammaproteobacteria bacterium]|nr:hypothetical protein [Gammaproteobacteria bacterium]